MAAAEDVLTERTTNCSATMLGAVLSVAGEVRSASSLLPSTGTGRGGPRRRRARSLASCGVAAYHRGVPFAHAATRLGAAFCLSSGPTTRQRPENRTHRNGDRHVPIPVPDRLSGTLRPLSGAPHASSCFVDAALLSISPPSDC